MVEEETKVSTLGFDLREIETAHLRERALGEGEEKRGLMLLLLLLLVGRR